MFNSKGLVLKTFIGREPSTGKHLLKRTYLFGNTLYEQQVCHYVPPVFLLLNYESSAFMRFGQNTTEEWPSWCRTDMALKENERIVTNLLETADCLPVSLQLSFLRFDNVGSLQSRPNAVPLPAVTVGCLVRAEFDNMLTRNKALNVLHSNRLANSDVYSINRDANACITVVSRYMESLFQHALKVESSWCPNNGAEDDTKKRKGAVNEDDDNIYEDNDLFSINFRVVETDNSSGGAESSRILPRKVEIIKAGPQRIETNVRERNSVASILTVHDVGDFFSLPFFLGDETNAAAQLEIIPVVSVRFEKDFFVLASCVEHRSRPVTMHVYYCWDANVSKTLTALADQSQSDATKICVQVVGDVYEAVTQLLKDSNGCFWKENVDTIVRLVTSSQADADAYSKYVLWPILVDRENGETSAALRMELNALTVDGHPKLFRSSIDLDCQKICAYGDARSCAFVKNYDSLMRDPSMRPNFSGTGDGRMTLSQLHGRQVKFDKLLVSFRSERVIAKAFRMAGELYCGLLDAFGLDEERWAGRAPDRFSNMFFLSTLIDKSEFFSSTTNMLDLLATIRNNNYKTGAQHEPKSLRQTGQKADSGCGGGGAQLVVPKPTSFAVEPAVFVSSQDTTICELDLESAYPSLIVKYNISPETTVILRTSDYYTLERTVSTQTQNPNIKLTDWFNVVDHVFGDLRILSIKREILQGCLARVMERLVLKRRAHLNVSVLSDFYKAAANRLYGNTSARGSDMYAVHCTSSVVSICKSLMANLLSSLGGQVLLQQVDGALVKSHTTCDMLTAVRDTAARIVDGINVRVKEVDACTILSPNKYVARYVNGTMKFVGQQGAKTLSHTAQDTVEDAVRSVLKECFDHEDYHQPELRCHVLIKVLLDRVLENVRSSEQFDTSECYFMDVRPCTDVHYNIEKKITFDNHIRLADTVAVWPIIKRDGDTLFKVLVTDPPVFGDRVKVDKLTVLRPLINAWARDLCTVFCMDTEETDRQPGYSATFTSIFKDYNDMYIKSVFGFE